MDNDETLRGADQIVTELRQAIRGGFVRIEAAREYLRMVLRDRMWTDRIIIQSNRPQRYQDFIKFVTDPPLEGLGSTPAAIEELAKGDQELIDLLGLAMRRPDGGANNPNGAGGKTHKQVVTVDNIHGDKPRARPTGTSRAAALRRLADSEDPYHKALANRVIAGELSANAAMLEAGLTKPRIGIPRAMALDDVARSLRQRYSEDERRALAALLLEDEDE